MLIIFILTWVKCSLILLFFIWLFMSRAFIHWHIFNSSFKGMVAGNLCLKTQELLFYQVLFVFMKMPVNCWYCIGVGHIVHPDPSSESSVSKMMFTRYVSSRQVGPPLDRLIVGLSVWKYSCRERNLGLQTCSGGIWKTKSSAVLSSLSSYLQ